MSDIDAADNVIDDQQPPSRQVNEQPGVLDGPEVRRGGRACHQPSVRIKSSRYDRRPVRSDVASRIGTTINLNAVVCPGGLDVDPPGIAVVKALLAQV